MIKYILLSLNNIRKNKGQFISFCIIVMIAAIILNLGVITVNNYGGIYNQKFDKYNCADVYYTIFESDWSEDISEKAAKIDGVKAVETRKCIVMSGSAAYGDTKNTLDHVFFSMEDEHAMNTLVPDGETLDLKSTRNPIYISYWIYASGCRIGDQYLYTSSDKTYTYTIAGFTEDLMYGNNNCGKLAVYLTQQEFNELYNSVPEAARAVTLSLKIADRKDSKKVFTSLLEILSSRPAQNNNFGNYYKAASRNRTLMATISANILVAFSLIIVLINLLVINFRIKSSIIEEMQNMGVLKAIGYRNKQIIFTVVSPYLLLSVLCSAMGSMLSYLFMPLITGMIDKLSGLKWEQGFDIASAVITILVIFAMTALTAYVSAGKLRKYHPIEALHSGIKHHNYKRNYFNLEKTGSHIHIAMAAKNLTGSLKQNIFLFVVITVMTFGGIYAGSGMFNSVIDKYNFIDALSEENPAVSITASSKEYGDEIIGGLGKDSRVKKLFYYDQNDVFIGRENIPVFITDSYDRLNNNLCYQGNYPRHNNEIALGTKTAEEVEAGIGDFITVGSGNTKEKYLVVGLIQAPNYNSEACEMTISGFQRICSSFQPSTIYLYLSDKYSSGVFVKDAIKVYGDKISSYNDYDTMINSLFGNFIPLISFMIGSISVVILLLTLLVLYMMIKTIILHRRQELGILKSVGYTTKQLMLQTAMSFLPAIVSGALAGGILGQLMVNRVWLACFFGMGVRKISLSIPVLWTAGIILAIIIFAFTAAVLLSGKIRRISVIKLITE